jgi:hypothetical protein
MKKTLNEILKESAWEHAMEPPVESWGFIEEALHKKKKRKILPFFILLLSLLVLAIGIYFFQKNKTQQNYITKAEQNIIGDTISIKYDTLISKAEINSIVNKKIEGNNYTNIKSTKKIKNKELDAFAIPNPRKVKFKNKLRVQITAPRQEEELAMVEKETEENNINEEAITIEQKESELLVNKEDSNQKNSETKSLAEIYTKKINTDTNIVAQKIKLVNNKKIKKFEIEAQLNYTLLYVNKNNIFNTNAEKIFLRDSYTAASNPGVRPSNRPISDLKNGKSIALNINTSKMNTKKFKMQFGINFMYNDFYTKAYNAIPVSILGQNNILSIDSTSIILNSNYSNSPDPLSLGGKIFLKNKFYNIGISLGLNYTLLKLKNNNSLKIQTQLIPSYLISKNIYL